jgi:TonB family protein
MKSRSMDFGSQAITRWYAEKPFAYKAREEFQRRMIVGLIVGTAIFLLLLAIYFIQMALKGEVEIIQKKKIVTIDAQSVPPPPPSEVKEIEQTTESGGESAGGPSGDVSTSSSARAEVSGQAAAAVDAALAAVASGLFSESGGIPTPSEGATSTGEGLLGSLSAGGGLSGVSGVGAVGSGALGGGEIGFGGGGLGSGGLGGGIGRGSGVGGGGGGRGTGIGSRSGRIGARVQKLNVQQGLRTEAEIKRVVDNYTGAVQECYAVARGQGAEAQGQMKVRIIIAPDGVVTGAQTLQTSIKNDNMGRCVQAKVRRMKFSQIPGNTNQSVDIPYSFTDSE